MGGAGDLDDKAIRKLLKRFRVTTGKGFKLANHDPAAPVSEPADKGIAEQLLRVGVERLSKAQERLYADSHRAMLIVFQAMDAGGKDGTIKHVMSGVNPQGVTVTAFKQPSAEELAHDFLWRVHRALPARGMIGIFNRSHYEEVLVTRVHPERLAPQRLPPGLVDRKGFWPDRLDDIRWFESFLARQGTAILKVFLHISPEEQKRRFLARLDDPDKTWKFQPGDIAERARWRDYQDAYQDAIAGTATEEAPWFVIPGDQKWFARLAVVSAINATFDDLDLTPTATSAQDSSTLADLRRALEHERNFKA